MGSFTNYVYKRRGVGGQKKVHFLSTFISKVENVNGGRVGGQKKPKSC